MKPQQTLLPAFGLSIGQNGCAGVYPAMLATIVAPAAGMDVFSIQFILLLVAIVTISSFGVGWCRWWGNLCLIDRIRFNELTSSDRWFSYLRREPLIDMARTAVNVSGSMVAVLLQVHVSMTLIEM